MSEHDEKRSGRLSPIILELMRTYPFKNILYLTNEQIDLFLRKRRFVLLRHLDEISSYYTFHDATRETILRKWRHMILTGQYKNYPPKFRETIDSLRLREYSPRTIRIYGSSIVAMHQWTLEKYEVSLEAINETHAREYFLHLIDRGASGSLIRIARFSLLYYYRRILRRSLALDFLLNIRTSKHLPTVFSRDQIELLISCLPNPKHRLILGILYSGGLRVSEVTALRKGDVNIETLTLKIRNAKGRKDRITIFSRRLLPDLETFVRSGGPTLPLFPSGPDLDGRRPLSVRTVQKIFDHALKKSGINIRASPHDLRHSFATHLLENGTDIRMIQQLLGHKNLSTTSIYTKVADPQIKGVRSPL